MRADAGQGIDKPLVYHWPKTKLGPKVLSPIKPRSVLHNNTNSVGQTDLLGLLTRTDIVNPRNNSRRCQEAVGVPHADAARRKHTFCSTANASVWHRSAITTSSPVVAITPACRASQIGQDESGRRPGY